MNKKHLSPPSILSFACCVALGLFGLSADSYAAPFDKADIVYGHVGEQDLQLDVYGADAAQMHPAILFLHGGGWSGGSRAEMASVSTFFSEQGYVCFAVSYRLVKGDQNRYPAQIDDVQRAVRWIRAHATDYGVDGGRIGAFGGSAGGQLAALLGTMETRDNSDGELAKYSSRVQCVVDLYGPSDFLAIPSVKIIDEAQRKAANRLLEGFLGPLPENSANYVDASPVTHIDSKTVPFLIFHGSKDALVPVEQSEELDVALRKAGMESKLVVFPGLGHAYSDPDALNYTVTASLKFFDGHLKKSQKPASAGKR